MTQLNDQTDYINRTYSSRPSIVIEVKHRRVDRQYGVLSTMLLFLPQSPTRATSGLLKHDSVSNILIQPVHHINLGAVLPAVYNYPPSNWWRGGSFSNNWFHANSTQPIWYLCQWRGWRSVPKWINWFLGAISRRHQRYGIFGAHGLVVVVGGLCVVWRALAAGKASAQPRMWCAELSNVLLQLALTIHCGFGNERTTLGSTFNISSKLVRRYRNAVD